MALEQGKQIRNGRELKRYGTGDSVKQYGNGVSVKRYGTGDSVKQYGNGESVKRYGSGESVKQYGNGVSVKRYGTGDSVKQYGNGESAKRYGTGDRGKQYGNGESAKRYGIGDRGKQYGNGESVKRYGTGDSVKQYGNGVSVKRYGTGDSVKQYGNGESVKLYGNGDRGEQYGTGESVKRYGTGDRVKKYGTGESAKRYDTGDSVKRYDHGGSVKQYGNGESVKPYGTRNSVKRNGTGDSVKKYGNVESVKQSGNVGNITKYSKLGSEKDHDDSVQVHGNGNRASQDIGSIHGLQLAKAVRHECSLQHTQQQIKTMMHFIPGKEILYCPVEKIATTFWRRILYTFSIKDSRYKLPFEIPEDTAQVEIKKRFSKTIAPHLPVSSFTFLFVRNPFSRILSAFIDKIVAPNPYYWLHFGEAAIQLYRKSVNGSSFKGHSITFAEFVRFVTDVESSPKVYSDPHIKSIDNSCHPCGHNYSFIGRMETFKEDALYVLQKLDTQQHIVKSIEDQWEELSIEAAIKFNIDYCFISKQNILKYISWEKALQRLWLHLQMRGVIAKNQILNITKETVEKLTVTDFVELAKKANKASSESELTRQKLAVKREAYAGVGLSNLKKFTKLFRNDFNLFGYSDSPSYIFQSADSPITPQFFNYSHLN
ncbi:uncharacterized protein LOC128548631 [Mercenaria mercenaria]|uniref:uncharacterized protein LOC128548631 n=1 Tax=Mercenaria mercenaria TaxID=6596 RepID=UPI00234F6709|nr:uncharacterized protein LOC128548631 [Mercenaria mercenaria]